MYINIDDIKNNGNSSVINFEDEIEFDGQLYPIQAKLYFEIYDNIMEIKGDVAGTIKLACNRCLKETDYSFSYEIDEFYALNSLLDKYPEEYEIKEGNFVNDLNGKKDFYINQFLYEIITINLPNNYVCDINCIEDNENIKKYFKTSNEDPRMAIFKEIIVKEKE